jgi:uncharacterized protein involved in exopolysaccharide biosynthesis
LNKTDGCSHPTKRSGNSKKNILFLEFPFGPFSRDEVAQRKEEFNLRDYWKVLQKRRWSILACLLITIITTALVTFAMRPIYRGRTTIQINKRGQRLERDDRSLQDTDSIPGRHDQI